MPHRLSLQCYLQARENPFIPPAQYKDLKALATLFQSTDRSSFNQFIFRSRVPKLLIVEDEIDLTAVLIDGFSEVGYPEDAIQVITSGEEAINYVNKNTVDIALVDIRLMNQFSIRGEYLSGLHVLKAIKEASPEAKVILISGFMTYAMVCKAILEQGASYHLDKPVTLADIGTIVQWVIDQSD